MNALRMKRPSPAFVVAMIALFVALGGTQVPLPRGRPLAKRALVADNAKKLGGQTLAQLSARLPRLRRPRRRLRGPRARRRA